jgi:hypothetical protein
VRAASPGRLRAETSGIASGGAARNEASSLPFLFRNAAAWWRRRRIGQDGQEDGGSFVVQCHCSKRNRLQSSPRRYPPPKRADSAKHTTKLSLLRHATRFPNGQTLPSIPPHSFVCVTLPASGTGRLCQAYHHTHSFALPYPLPERADSVKHITTLFPLRYPTRCRNGQTRPKIPPHSFFCVTLPVSRMGRFPQTCHNTLSFLLRYPLPEWADSAKHTTTLFLLPSHV